MILQNISKAIREQNYYAVTLEFVIVVAGVLLAMQVGAWNERRSAVQQKDLIIEALVNDISDHIAVQTRFIDQIGTDLDRWEQAYRAGERPAPVVFRINGSDSAPDTWGTLRQMPVATLLDPTSAVMLTYYYSELDGLSEKYLRYVRFVETEVLPNFKAGGAGFYTETGELRPVYAANLDRLREQRAELVRITAWAQCIVAKLEDEGRLDEACSRNAFQLDVPLAGSGAP